MSSEREFPERVWAYVDRFIRRAENSGRGTQYPTVRLTAHRFKVKQSVIRDIVENRECRLGNFDLLVGIRVGNAVGDTGNNEGDYQIEAYK